MKRKGIAMSKMAAAMAACLVALVTAMDAGPARAQQEDFRHIINLTAQQGLLAERMGLGLVLIAMGQDTDQSVRALRDDREQFDRVLKGLRYGDPLLPLNGTRDPEILSDLSKIELLWPRFDTIVRDAVESRRVSASQVDSMADLGRQLLAAIDDTIEAYERNPANDAFSSMLTSALGRADRQRVLCYRMTKEYLLIAYGHDVNRYRASLREAVATFDKSVKGLIDGDPDLTLIPAPTAQIKDQLMEIERIWSEFKPVLDPATMGEKIDTGADSMLRVSGMSSHLFVELSTVVEMYEAL